MYRIRKLLTVLALLQASLLFSQYEKGSLVMTGGVSLMPGINFLADCGMSPKVSIGLAYTRTWYEGVAIRDNFALRPLYHFDNRKNWDFFVGARVGLSYWHSRDSSEEYSSYFIIPRKYGETYPSLQFLVGARYLAGQRVGVTTELGLGFPYIASIGLSYNLRKKQNPEESTVPAN